MRPLLVYTAARIGLFAVALGVSYLVLSLFGVHNTFILLIAAFLTSGLASYVLLSRQRDKVSEQISKVRDH